MGLPPSMCTKKPSMCTKKPYDEGELQPHFSPPCPAQGFFVHMLLHRHAHAARYARLLPGLHDALHYGGGGGSRKPWALAIHGRPPRRGGAGRGGAEAAGGGGESAPLSEACPMLRYLERAAPSNASGGWCARSMRRAREKLQARLARAPLPPFPACLRYVAHGCGAPLAPSWPFALL